MAGNDRANEGRQAGVPARISETTHRELRYVAAVWSLSAKDGAPTTIRSLIDLAWETLKQQRPEVVELLKRVDSAEAD
ncbi:hypothetical protein EYB53_000030 [Candidatus Chloroploca sp. M-50]|jgi:hypothetical protein|uniref:Uncharacterized protein n=2 Tax=Candidatus Chloroploca TaxID=1579476 RepID=A0A2H3L3D4_9CHLR|nr:MULTISPECIES: hypothetical protein [Candidatus Chloroploca]MBP1464087.1 hypothetical protein [Candidatus Chloroploca mongolica]PDW01157.1 hypothetical protein A9Q02_22835 [Candidatus Chloroploca asiatica]